MYGLFYVFFFQAEDGIRDDLVTGVQTCALPIYRKVGRLLTGGCAFRDGRCQHRRVDEDRARHQRGRRSEERRGGKEGGVTGREADEEEVVPGRDAEVDRTRGGRRGARRGRGVIDRVG